jgi:3-oxoadipate enol-lactonase
MSRSRSRIVTVLAGWAAWRLLGPEPSPRFVGRQRRPEGPTGRTVVVGRDEFFVREAGPEDAPPVLLLHGWLYDGHVTWHRIVPDLAERYRVIVLDLRNHGKTDRIRSHCDIADMADDVARVLDTLGLGPLPVVGYSLGGMVAQELALRSPGRVTGLVLGGTAAHPVDRPRWLSVPAFVLARVFSRIDRFLLPRIAYTYLMKTGTVPAEHGAWIWRSLLDRDTDLYYAAGFAILRFDARDRVGSIGVPTTCVIPTEDQLVRPHLQRETAELIPGATVVELVGARHEAILTHADDITKAISESLQGLDR